MNFSAPVKITDVYLICCCYVHVPRSVDLYLQLFANKKKKKKYSSPSTLRPPKGPSKCGYILWGVRD